MVFETFIAMGSPGILPVRIYFSISEEHYLTSHITTDQIQSRFWRHPILVFPLDCYKFSAWYVFYLTRFNFKLLNHAGLFTQLILAPGEPRAGTLSLHTL